MSVHLHDDDNIKAIADAIRLKRDIVDEMTVGDMPMQIGLIGGGDSILDFLFPYTFDLRFKAGEKITIVYDQSNSVQTGDVTGYNVQRVQAVFGYNKELGKIIFPNGYYTRRGRIWQIPREFIAYDILCYDLYNRSGTGTNNFSGVIYANSTLSYNNFSSTNIITMKSASEMPTSESGYIEGITYKMHSCFPVTVTYETIE